MCECMDGWIDVCMDVCMYGWMHARTNARTHVCIYAGVYISVCVCAPVRIHVHNGMFVCFYVLLKALSPQLYLSSRL